MPSSYYPWTCQHRNPGRSRMFTLFMRTQCSIFLKHKSISCCPNFLSSNRPFQSSSPCSWFLTLAFRLPLLNLCVVHCFSFPFSQRCLSYPLINGLVGRSGKSKDCNKKINTAILPSLIQSLFQNKIFQCPVL